MSDERKALDAVLEALRVDELIRQAAIELPKEKPLEAALEELKRDGVIRSRTGKIDGRIAAGKKRAKKNKARKRKNKQQQRWRRNWNKRMLEEAQQGNWFPYLEGRWRRRKRPLAFSEAEWLEHVQPNIPDGCVIELRRYDTEKLITLDNIVVYNNANGDVLFDGSEWYLKQQGYTL